MNLAEFEWEARWCEYERQKQDWIAKHPEATTAEYDRAMREISARCWV